MQKDYQKPNEKKNNLTNHSYVFCVWWFRKKRECLEVFIVYI